MWGQWAKVIAVALLNGQCTNVFRKEHLESKKTCLLSLFLKAVQPSMWANATDDLWQPVCFIKTPFFRKFAFRHNWFCFWRTRMLQKDWNLSVMIDSPSWVYSWCLSFRQSLFLVLTGPARHLLAFVTLFFGCHRCAGTPPAQCGTTGSIPLEQSGFVADLRVTKRRVFLGIPWRTKPVFRTGDFQSLLSNHGTAQLYLFSKVNFAHQSFCAFYRQRLRQRLDSAIQRLYLYMCSWYCWW